MAFNKVIPLSDTNASIKNDPVPGPIAPSYPPISKVIKINVLNVSIVFLWIFSKSFLSAKNNATPINKIGIKLINTEASIDEIIIVPNTEPMNETTNNNVNFCSLLDFSIFL